MDESTKLKAHNKYRKAKYTSQDVRIKALEARDELLANVDFLMEVIREDRYNLKRYKEKHGDLRYRPIVTPGSEDGSIGPTYGSPTELVLEPVASKYRATVKSLLDSIKLITTEILPEDNPEGETSEPTSESKDEATNKRQSLRDQFKSMSENPSAFKPQEPETTEDVEDFTSQVKQGLSDADQGRVKTTQQVKTTVTNKPWRETTPKAQSKLIPKKQDVVKEPESKPENKETKAIIPRGMLDRLRARVPERESSLDRIRAQYGIERKKDDDSEDEDV